MKNIGLITWRDFKSYFTSPIAYIVIAGFMLIIGWMFFNILVYFVQIGLRYMQMNMGGKGPSLTDGVIRPIFQNMNVVLLFFIPFITMRLFAEEKKNKTIELLLTSPLTLTQVVLGKFLSAYLLIVTMLLITVVFPLTIWVVKAPDLGVILSCYVGTLLLAACYVGMGVFFSAMTENQIVAAALTFAANLFFWLISWATQSAGPVLGDILTYLSLISHLQNFTQGILSTNDIIYYFSFTGVMLFLTHRVMDSYRWR